MQAQSPHGQDDPAMDAGRDTPADTTPEPPRRRPVISVFTRRAFFSKETGRWHKFTGGRDHPSDERADDPGTRDAR